MKFRFLLWMLGRLMAKASRTNAEFQQQLEGKELVFQLHTPRRQGCPSLPDQDKRVTSHAGVARGRPSPSVSRTPLYGFATMNARTNSWPSCGASRTRTSRSRATRRW